MKQIILTCDRCGSEIKGTLFRFKRVTFTNYGYVEEEDITIESDLCDGCVEYIEKEIKFGDKK